MTTFVNYVIHEKLTNKISTSKLGKEHLYIICLLVDVQVSNSNKKGITVSSFLQPVSLPRWGSKFLLGRTPATKNLLGAPRYQEEKKSG